MASRPTRKKPSVDLFYLIRHKIGEAAFFLQHLKHHREQQEQPVKPSPQEFLYYLSAFLNAAYSVGELIERKKKWWRKLNRADQALYKLMMPEMRGDIVHRGHVETTQKTDTVPIRFDTTDRVQGFFINHGLFGEATTHAVTHSVKLDGKERELVGLCEEYLAILAPRGRGPRKRWRGATVIKGQ
jgi:hypothetical protein